GHALGGACPSGCGGGMLISGPAQPTLDNVRFISNSAYFQGGGVYAESTLLAVNSQFISNTSLLGGSGAYHNLDAVITGGLFQSNQCTLRQGFGCDGGGLSVYTSAEITDTDFISNTSARHGGGLFSTLNASVAGGQFQGNACLTAGCAGGAINAGNYVTL